MAPRAVGLAIAGSESEITSYANGAEHLFAEFGLLRLMLHREMLRLKAANLFTADPFRGLYLSDEQVDAILRDWSAQAASAATEPNSTAPLADLTRQIEDKQEEIDARINNTLATGATLPLLLLASRFHLSHFECKVLLASLAVDFDLRFEVLYSYARNDVTRKRPSVGLLMKLLCKGSEDELRFRAAFREDSPLLRRQLIRLSEESQDRDPSFLARSLRVEERIARFLMEEPAIDKHLESFTALSTPARAFSSLHLPEQLRTELRNALRTEGSSVFFLWGPRGSGKQSAVEAICSEEKRPLLIADLRRASASGISFSTMLALLQREAVLEQANLFIAQAEALLNDSPEGSHGRAALEQMQVPQGLRVFVGSETPWPVAGTVQRSPWLIFEFPVPSFPDRLQLWQEAIQATGCQITPGIDLSILAGRFALTGGAIREACSDAARQMRLSGPEGAACTLRDLEAAARSQSSHGLRRFAQKVVGRGGWNSLVLPPYVIRQLRNVCAAVRHRQTVYAEWGFDQALSSGKGLNALFCGVSGTGKTMAAGILARELGLDLYRIDLSIVVSKYIGETEKQLSLIFREAQSSNAVLLFDEADALFGKRSEVKDAHDRYANVEVAYLLQKMEEYEGIVILATNLRRNMDDAFTRRMHHVIEFPFPDAEHRERIWRGILPSGAPLAADVNFSFLARQFELAGGNIRNIALAAAFLAAEEDTSIRMEHFIVATALEMQKAGKLPSRSEFREYYDLIRTRT